jgi:hypothetical protein
LLGSFVDRLAVKLVESERAQHAHDEVEQRGDLVLRLILGAEDVAVVLREAADPHEPVQRPGRS